VSCENHARNADTAMIEVTFLTNSGKIVTAPENSNLLRVSLREKGGIPFKCGGGLCGTCKCLIERGLENTDAIKPKERKHLTKEQVAAGYRMACQTFLNGDVSVSWTVNAGIDSNSVGASSSGS
jgi:ferredoxin